VSRLWSRFGIRAIAVGLLVMGVAGGAYLGKNRETQQTGIDAAGFTEVDLAEQDMIKDHMRQQSILLANKRAAEQQARAKAAAAAKAAALRAKQAEEAASRKRAEREAAEKESKPPPFGPIPSSCKEYSGNRAIGCALMLDAGFKLDQMPCLDKLWTKESGWNEKASNDSTGAYGVPQALPGDKMAAYGDDWKTNPATQIKWGLNYIEGRYDTPCGGWTHFQNAGWY
jgi:hypothetical protein